MNPRLARLLTLQPGEGRLVALVIGVMAFTSAGSALGGAGIEALFFARVGVAYLPYLYMVLGTLSFLTSLAMTALLGRVPRETLYRAVPLGLAVLLVGARALLILDWIGLYPALWLGKEVFNALVGLIIWGVAGSVCDLRQAKRLFPLFNAGRIFGQVIGGLGTGALVAWLGTENLLIAWALTLALAFACARLLLNRPGGPVAPPRRGRLRSQQAPSIFTEMQHGWRFVRRSPLMQLVSIAAVLFSVLYFSIALPFSKAATAQFPNEAALAGFLGLFNGLSTAAAFLASLFLANRVFARVGIMRAILALPLIYLAGFLALTVAPVFGVVVAVRFTQVLWLMGVADPAYQAMFNAVPGERRDQVRAFIGGVPEQAGTFLAGLILILGEQTFSSQMLALIGLAAAVLTTFVIARATRAYSRALADALRAGQIRVFAPEAETGFGSARLDALAEQAALEGLAHSDAAVRRIAAEVLGNAPSPSAAEALVRVLGDGEAQVRAAAVRALGQGRVTAAALEVAALLDDADPEVRLEAVNALPQLALYPRGLKERLQPRLADQDPFVRTRAAVELLRLGAHPEARASLRSQAMLGETDERVAALQALGDWGDAEACTLLAVELADTAAPNAVRRAAAAALAHCGEGALAALSAALASDERIIREAAAVSLSRLGPPALAPALAALDDPARESGALLALEGLPTTQAAPIIRRFAERRIASALHDHANWQAVVPHAGDDRVRLLAEALQERAQQSGVHALQALQLTQRSASLTAAIENLQSRDPGQRATALETLEASRFRRTLRPLLRLWETSPAAPAAGESVAHSLDETLTRLLEEAEPWLRACAVLAASSHQMPSLRAAAALRAQSDPDPLVRETGQLITHRSAATHPVGTREDAMDTLPTLSVMERILFLRRAPLFADLSAADLRRVAAITSEVLFLDGDLIAAQGEPGEEMYLIVSGEVRVLVSTPDCPEIELVRRQPGDVVGEMAIISGEPRAASLVAAGDVRVLCLDQKNFEGLLRERPEVSLAVMRELCARLKAATK